MCQCCGHSHKRSQYCSWWDDIIPKMHFLLKCFLTWAGLLKSKNKTSMNQGCKILCNTSGYVDEALLFVPSDQILVMFLWLSVVQSGMIRKGKSLLCVPERPAGSSGWWCRHKSLGSLSASCLGPCTARDVGLYRRPQNGKAWPKPLVFAWSHGKSETLQAFQHRLPDPLRTGEKASFASCLAFLVGPGRNGGFSPSWLKLEDIWLI